MAGSGRGGRTGLSSAHENHLPAPLAEITAGWSATVVGKESSFTPSGMGPPRYRGEPVCCSGTRAGDHRNDGKPTTCINGTKR
jgi:hypothetical protein